MRPELISACQMFLVPSAIMFAALGVAGSEGLKTVICAMGAATSDIWIWTVYRWKDAPPADPGVILPPSDSRAVLMLSLLFAAAWGICFFVHLGYGYAYGFRRQKEAQAVYFTRKPKPVRPLGFRLRSRLRYDGRLLLWRLKKLARFHIARSGDAKAPITPTNIPMVTSMNS
jgi:hypothetical protein